MGFRRKAFRAEHRPHTEGAAVAGAGGLGGTRAGRRQATFLSSFPPSVLTPALALLLPSCTPTPGSPLHPNEHL